MTANDNDTGSRGLWARWQAGENCDDSPADTDTNTDTDTDTDRDDSSEGALDCDDDCNAEED